MWGTLLFLLSITALSKMVLFEHLSASEYRNILKQSQGQDADDNIVCDNDDLQAIFTRYFVRGSQASLRKNVCRPEVAKLGLFSMSPDSCPAICWDFTNSFGQRTSDQNERTFNGIHSPRDRDELISDLSVLKRLL